ncbi:Ty1/Copia family ribonuclease HI, partial [Actinobacillus pleuropneumoniae]|uniref:Ty1/Copia family ribonuclease HI n=1 Tax=Actinobacillus pleuropneumoniae TaxID=715 RepID=UPI00227AB1FE
ATVATSSTEAEHISAWEAACEIVWLRRILQDLGISQVEATSLFIDSDSTIKLATNPVFHSKTKHVDTKYHHIRSLIAKDVLKPVYCPSEDQISDIF